MEFQYKEEKAYLNAKKKVKDIKGFYIHLLVNLLSLPIIIVVNLVFSPGYHWFWFPTAGILIVTLIHWFMVFGESKFGFGKDWEDSKIKELMEEEKKRLSK